jgi:hypothetical protein
VTTATGIDPRLRQNRYFPALLRQPGVKVGELDYLGAF